MGEILMGVLIGVSGFGWLNANDPNLQTLSSMGLVMLMYLIGTKLPLRDPQLKDALKHSFGGLGLAFVIAAPLAFALSKFTSLHSMPMYLLLLACSSTAVVMPMVLERKLTGPIVLLTTTWVMVADVSTVVLVPLAMYPSRLPQIALGVVVITACAGAAMVGLKYFRESDWGDRLRKISKERELTFDLRLNFIILFALCIMAARFGTSMLVPGFAAGAIVAKIAHPKRFTKQLNGVAGALFVPLFFVTLGAKLDFTQLFHNWHYIALSLSIVVSSVVVHVIVAKAMRLPWASGLMAATQQGLPIALVALGMNDGLLNAGQAAALIAAAMLLLVTASIGASRLDKLVPHDTTIKQPDSQEPPPNRTDEQ
jgi:Kef-type K+ transport system membrane component KefB